MLKGKDGIDDVQQILISFLSAIKDSEEKDRPHLALGALMGHSILDLDRFITNYNEPAGSRCVGVWLEETGVIDVCRDYAVAVLDAHNFNVKSTIRQLMRLGWLGVTDMADLVIITATVRLILAFSDVVVNEYNDGQVLTDMECCSLRAGPPHISIALEGRSR